MTKSRPTVLVTNDDSIDSPLFALLIQALAPFCQITFAVPAVEHSWKGKSMTRHGKIVAEKVTINGHNGWSITGTPADCVNLAIHNLLDEKPDIVFSGINIGKNIGLGFCLASGTIGACLEANIAGIPACALSQELVPEDFMFWDKNRHFPTKTEAMINDNVPRFVQLVWNTFYRKSYTKNTTWNINFPYSASPESKIELTKLSKTFYEKCFVEKDNSFQFGLSKAIIDNSDNTDVAALEGNNISATLIDMTTIGQILT